MFIHKVNNLNTYEHKIKSNLKFKGRIEQETFNDIFANNLKLNMDDYSKATENAFKELKVIFKKIYKFLTAESNKHFFKFKTKNNEVITIMHNTTPNGSYLEYVDATKNIRHGK